jgi:hypothetical protein
VNYRLARLATLWTVLLLAGGCTAGSHRPPAGNLQAELRALETLPLPPGSDAATWQQLKTALRILLLNRPRATSAPPDDLASASVAVYDADTGVLSWDYASAGDYNQDGLVSINDLTPLGPTIGTSVTPALFTRESALSVIDVDRNGNINVSDMTSLGANYKVLVTHYNIYASTNELDWPQSPTAPSTIAPLATVLHTAALGNKATERLHYTYTVPDLQPGMYYWVRPSDGSTEGIASNLTGGPPELSVELLACPPAGQAPVSVDFEAVVTPPDPGGEYQYEWDLDGDGFYEVSGGSPLASQVYTGTGVHQPRVRVTALGGSVEASVAISAGTTGWFRTTISGADADPPFGPVARCLEVIDGRPAFLANRASSDPQDAQELLYYRAADTAGEVWPAPLQLVTGEVTPEASVPILLDEPAGPLAFCASYDILNWEYATDPAGETWPPYFQLGLEANLTPVQLLAAGVVDGYPAAVVYTNRLWFTGSEYIPAMGGFAWGLPGREYKFPPDSDLRLYDPGYLLTGSTTTLVQPFLDNAEAPPLRRLEVFRALDAKGGDWSAPHELASDFRAAGAALIDGVPTVVVGGAQGFGAPDALLYIRATNSTGAAWNQPRVIGSDSGQVAIREIDGRPVVVFALGPDNPEGPSIQLLAADDFLGTRWSEPEVVGCPVGTDRFVSHIALAELTGGFPAVLYTVQSTDPAILPEVSYAWRLGN